MKSRPFSQSRKTQVNFQGMVETQQKNVWRIAGLQIEIDPEMAVNARIVPGSLVQVIGETENGIIKAEQIDLIRAPFVTPTTTPTLQPLPTWTPEQKRTHEPTEKVDERPNASETPEAPEIHDTQEPGKTETTGGREPSETPGSGDHGGGDKGGGDGGGDNGSSSSGGG